MRLILSSLSLYSSQFIVPPYCILICKKFKLYFELCFGATGEDLKALNSIHFKRHLAKHVRDVSIFPF